MDLLIEASIPAIRQGMATLGIEEDVWMPLLGPATVPDHGDLAIACHSLARVLRKSPVDIAEEICTSITPPIGSSLPVVMTTSSVLAIAIQPIAKVVVPIKTHVIARV